MSSDSTSAKGDAAALIGDACLFTAAAFCVLVLAPPAALVVGPVAAWLLHDRRIDRTTVVGGVVGILVGLVAVGGIFALLPLMVGAIGSVGGWQFTVPVAILAAVSAAFLALIIALDVDGVRDLMRAQRAHTRLDVARLLSTAVIAVFVAVVSFLQATRPGSEVGDAGVFALGAAAVGAITMAVTSAIHGRLDRRR